MEIETCRICGGDGRIANAFGGSSTTCPGCRGTGRRSMDTLMRDVTKTKPSHYRSADKAATAAKAIWPSTHDGTQLANEVKGSHLPDNVKERLIREIIEYEGTHGRCTQTFTKKIRKQVRASTG
jgi:DnaJ-class molecular chaperone